MSRTRKYVEAKEIEREMQEAREAEDFTGKVEKITIKQMVENAKVNSRFGDKVLTTINDLKMIGDIDHHDKIYKDGGYEFTLLKLFNGYNWDETIKNVKLYTEYKG